MELISRWKRRWWRADHQAIAALTGSRPAVVVTGGSHGIGKALAKTFRAPGHTVVLVARNGDDLDAARDAIQITDCPALTLSVDLTDNDAPSKVRSFLERHDLFADVLINSAGDAMTDDFIATAPECLVATVDLNVAGLTALCREFLPDMVTRGRGGIVNLASLGGFVPGPYQAAYYASKAYVISLSRALVHETRGQGVRISCVAPGPVNTGFHARAAGTTSLYRRILPALEAEQVAASTKRGYRLGHTLIVPGVFSNLLGLCLRLLPGALTIPIVGILLKPRHPRS